MTCKPCAKAGIERTATRILDGLPCCEACVRERYRPAWMRYRPAWMTGTTMTDEEFEKWMDEREAA